MVHLFKRFPVIVPVYRLVMIRCIGLKWPTGFLKFMIGHLGLDTNVQLGLVDFKVLQSAD